MPVDPAANPVLAAVERTYGPPADRPRPQSDLQPSPFVARHAHTFQGILTTAAKTYRWAFDEALRQSPSDARMMRLDGWIVAMLRERQRPVARAKWHIEAEDESNPEQQQASKLITKLVERIPRFSRLRMMLRECDWYGKYAVQTVTQRVIQDGIPRRTISNWLPVHGDKLIFRHDGTPCLLIWPPDRGYYESRGYVVQPTDKGLVLFLDREELRQRFIIDTFEIADAAWEEPDQAGSISGVGLRHHVQWLWWLRAEILSQLLDFMSLIGAGGLTVIWYEDGNDASKQKAEQVAKDLESGTTILAPRRFGNDQAPSGIERIEPNTAGAELLTRIVDSMFEDKIERLFVGQSASSSSKTSGMGTHNTDFQQDTKFQLIAGDAEDLDDSLTEDLIKPLMQWNLPGVDFRLRFVTDLKEPDPAATLEAVGKAHAMGVQFSANDVRQLTGMAAPRPGDDVTGAAAASPGAGGMPLGADLGANGSPMGNGNGHMPANRLTQYARDDQGHEHRGKGPGGGQFVKQGGGGKTSAKPLKPHDEIESLLADPSSVTRESLGRLVSKLATMPAKELQAIAKDLGSQPSEQDLEDAYDFVRARDAQRARMETVPSAPEASRDPTLMESAAGVERDPSLSRPGRPGRFGHEPPAPPPLPPRKVPAVTPAVTDVPAEIAAFLAARGLTVQPAGEVKPKPAGKKWSQSGQGQGHYADAVATRQHTPGSALHKDQPLPGPVRMERDAEGHEHRGKGPGGGQFTAGGSGGGGGSGESTDNTDSWLALAKNLPRAAMHKARTKVVDAHAKLEKRYGRKYATAIVAAGLAGVPLPLPGASLATAAPVIAVAELHRYLSGRAS